MAERKITSRNKKSSGKTTRRKKSKVKFDYSKVSLLCGIIFLGCCICIAVNVLGSPSSDTKPVQKQSISIEHNVPQNHPAKKTPSSNKEAKKTSADAVAVNSASSKKKSSSSTKKIESSQKNSTSTSSVTESLQNKQNASLSQKNPVIVASAKGDILDDKPAFSIPPAKNGATLVIVIDDAGRNVEYTRRYAKLPFPVTIAVLPKLVHSKDCAYVVRSYGQELILHQPMQSLNHSLDPGPGKITVDMSFSEISSIINENLAEIGPGVKGLNNHEGSEVTEDVIRIGCVLDVCTERGIYFLDSRTTANTKAPQAALERDIKIFEKSGPYIDNVVNEEAMKKEIYKALELANKNGKTIIIGHVDKSANILPKLLSDMYPYLVEAGYKFAVPSMLK